MTHDNTSAAECERSARELWPLETKWPEFTPEALFSLWKIHASGKPTKFETDDFARQVMLLVALYLGRNQRKSMLDRVGFGASDFAQLATAHVMRKAPNYKMKVEHKLALIKGINTSLHRLMADALESVEGNPVDASSLCDEEDPMAWMAGQPPARDIHENLVDKLCDEAAIVAACKAAEVEVEDVIRQLWRLQAETLVSKKNTLCFANLPRWIRAELDATLATFFTTKMMAHARSLCA